MSYLYAFVFLALLFSVLHYFTELSIKQKGITIFLFVIIVFAAYLYNSYSASQQEKILQITRDFQNGKTLTCMGKDINSSNYTLSIGTYTFIGKENTPNSGDMVSVSSCQ